MVDTHESFRIRYYETCRIRSRIRSLNQSLSPSYVRTWRTWRTWTSMARPGWDDHGIMASWHRTWLGTMPLIPSTSKSREVASGHGEHRENQWGYVENMRIYIRNIHIIYVIYIMYIYIILYIYYRYIDHVVAVVVLLPQPWIQHHPII